MVTTVSKMLNKCRRLNARFESLTGNRRGSLRNERRSKGSERFSAKGSRTPLPVLAAPAKQTKIPRKTTASSGPTTNLLRANFQFLK